MNRYRVAKIRTVRTVEFFEVTAPDPWAALDATLDATPVRTVVVQNSATGCHPGVYESAAADPAWDNLVVRQNAGPERTVRLP